MINGAKVVARDHVLERSEGQACGRDGVSNRQADAYKNMVDATDDVRPVIVAECRAW